MSGHPHTWHFPLVTSLFPLPLQHILIAGNAATRRAGGIRLPPRAAHLVGLQETADYFIVFAQRPLPETFEQQLLAQVGPATGSACAAFAQRILAQLLQSLRIAFGLLRGKPALVQNAPAALLLEASAITAHGIVHTRQAILAARGKDQRARSIFYSSRANQHREGDTLYKRKMRLQ